MADASVFRRTDEGEKLTGAFGFPCRTSWDDLLRLIGSVLAELADFIMQARDAYGLDVELSADGKDPHG
jgi:hypothetical protein